MVGHKDHAAGMYQCGLCKAEYGRADHLVRHIRSHTKQRPFVCTVCGKGFARQDLLKRHLSAHSKDGSNDLEVVAQAEAAMLAQLDRHGHRVSQACRSCAAKKVKCTNSKPCERCREHGLQCDYEQGPASAIASTPQNLGHSETAMPDSHVQDNLGHGETAMPDSHVQENIRSASMVTVPNALQCASTTTLPINEDDNNNTVMQYGAAAENPYDDFIALQNDAVQDILNSTFTLPDFGDYIDIDADPVLGDIDFAFLNNPFNNSDAARSLPNDAAVSATPASGVNSTVSGVIAEAYRKSRVHEGWEPGREDRHDPEHQDLNLPPGTSSECLLSSDRPPASMLKKTVPSPTRDRLLAMIFQTCSPQARERVVESFPTRQVLGDLINFALAKMADLQSISIIHVPSFDVSQQRPELLAALIAYGSVCSPSSALRKFGYAIQDAVRIAILRMTENRHAVLRQQDVCQAFYIQLYLAYWSAARPKIEIAEGMSMMGTTLLRRGKMLQRQNYDVPDHFLNLSDLSLHEQWLRWVEQECRKRLVYFAVTLDAQISASRDTNILFHYPELETPLPSTSRLWGAETAMEWQGILLDDARLRTQQPESLCTILRPPCAGPYRSTISDAKCSDLAFLAGYWALIHEYQGMSAVLQPTQPRSDFVLSSRHSELSTGLQQFATGLAHLEEADPEVVIIQNFVSLHLHVAFYELSKYAGIRTDADARLAVPYVQDWYDGPHSRPALWYAGQIFRAAKLMAAGSLNDVFAVALYHAAVTLWAWGLLARTRGAVRNDTIQTVALDCDETLAVVRFLKAWPMVPGLTSDSGKFLPLDSLAAAPNLAHEIIVSNYRGQTLPLTADEVSRLMQGISGICNQRFKEISA